MSKTLEIFSDGACSGNPGPAAIGVVIKENGAVIRSLGQSIGQSTNNIAEYTALIVALEEALKLKAEKLILHTDSELMFHQIRGTYKVKNEQLKVLNDRIKELSKQFQRIELKRVDRSLNADADLLAKQAIQPKADQDGCPDVFVIGEESPSSGG